VLTAITLGICSSHSNLSLEMKLSRTIKWRQIKMPFPTIIDNIGLLRLGNSSILSDLLKETKNTK
jgi:hypothetical protein